MLLNYIVWDPSPEIFSIGSFTIRWYSLLFALGFVFGYMIMKIMFKKENVPVKLLDKLATYMVIATIIGARLGHCMFYEPEHYLANPIDILKIWEGGLASHGAAIGILIALYLFARKSKKSYFWTLDRIVIVVALAGCLIRTGNLMNSEIYGNETQTTSGFVYINNFQDELIDGKTIDDAFFDKPEKSRVSDEQKAPVEMTVEFTNNVRDSLVIQNIIENHIIPYFRNEYTLEYFNMYYPAGKSPDYKIIKPAGQTNYSAIIQVYSTPRYPTQIYEAVAYLLIFFYLLGYYYYKKGKPRSGFLLGMFLILIFTTRFFIEFLKAPQVDFETGMILNMGQWLSIPFVMIGIAIVIWSYRKREEKKLHKQ